MLFRYCDQVVDVYQPPKDEVSASKQKSKLAGIEEEETRLPAIENRQTYHRLISPHSRYMYKKSEFYYKSLSVILSYLNAAEFYVDINMKIFNFGGNPELLAELKQRNLAFGADISESRIGFSAVSLCCEKNRMEPNVHRFFMLLEGESYLKALQPYIWIAAPLQSRYRSYGTHYRMIAVKPEHFNDHIPIFTKILLDLDQCNSAYSYNMPPIAFVESFRENDSDILVYTDDRGYIIHVNVRACEVFHTHIQAIGGQPIEKFLAELQETVESVKSGEHIFKQYITLHTSSGAANSYYMDAIPICDEKILVGMLFLLRGEKEARQSAERLISSGAFVSFDEIIGGSSKTFHNQKQFAEQVAAGSSNILITGESGTGKDLFAQAIHNASSRRAQPFVSINCAAIPKELISSELFGYEAGAFTGAKKAGHPGKFEIADGGTILLDEIGEMPLDMQSVLLRVIEERAITRLGSSKSKNINVRVIAATNRDLIKCIQEKTFRADLYFRLNVLSLNLLPLRQRKEDIPLLVDYYLERFFAEFGKRIDEVGPGVMKMLMEYAWPGNVRELRNVLERTVNMVQGTTITTADITLGRQPSSSDETNFRVPRPETGDAPVVATPSINRVNQEYASYERELIQSLIIKHRNNKTLVAQELGISRRTLYNKLKNFY